MGPRDKPEDDGWVGCGYDDSMQRLIVFRHAKAERTSPTGEDFDRPLAPSGREDALLVAPALAEAGFKPALARVSPARRTIQTWEAAAVAFPQARAEIIRNLFHADADTLIASAEGHADRAETLMLVAHKDRKSDVEGKKVAL